MSIKHSELAKLSLLVLMLFGSWLVLSEASFVVGFLLTMGSVAGIVVIMRRANSLPLGPGEREGWEIVRAKGKRHYILRSVMYGLFVGSLFLLYQVIRSLWSGEPFTASSGFLLVALFIIVYIGGSCYAAITKWALYEERYKESLPQEPQQNNGMQRTRN